MSSNPSPSASLVHTGSKRSTAVSPDPDFDVLWAAWQARGAAHERMIRRRVVILAATLAIPAAILYSLWLR